MKDGRRLNTVLEGKYTLVHEVTTTEAVSSLIYDCDTTNELYFYLSTPATGEGSNAVGVVKTNNKPLLYSGSMTRTGSAGTVRAKIYLRNGMLSVLDNSSVNSIDDNTLDWGADLLKYSIAQGGLFVDSIITLETVLLSGRVFPIGTVFKVYEVK